MKELFNRFILLYSSGSPPKPKSKLKSRLKKAALVGVGVYAGYKVAKLASKFSSRGSGWGNSYKYNDWNDWREADGFLCRSNKDCQWIDNNLNCEDYELEFTPLVKSNFIKFTVYRLSRQ